MSDEQYTIADFVNDLRRLRAGARNESELIDAVAPYAKRAALSSSWRNEKVYNADATQGFGATVLSVEPDNTLFVVAASWLPGRGAPPHDHGTWAVIVGVDGAEINTLWKRTDDRSRAGYAEIEKIKEQSCDVGDVLTLPAGAIHSVHNASDRTTLSFHVYGLHFNHTVRSQYDPERKTATELKVKTQ